MGLTELLHNKRVYLDANIFIYAIEQVTPHNHLLNDLFAQIDVGNISACTSSLTLAEVLVKPFADNNHALVDIYKNLLITTNIIKLIEINQPILIQAALYRSLFNVKLADAIHLATSKQADVDFFLTNDRFIRTHAMITVLQLSDFS